MKFTPSGSVRVEIQYVADSEQLPRIRFDVCDTGAGMTAEQLEKLFRPFQQADDSVANRFGGTGLGLAISRRLATLLNGDLSVRSTPGQGTIVTLTVTVGERGTERLIDVAAQPVVPEPRRAFESSPLIPRLPGAF